MRTVALEEHYANPSFLDGPGRELKDQALKFGGPAAKLLEQLCEVGAMRIAEMDAAGIDMQCFRLLLQAPSNPRPRMLRPLREANDFLADDAAQGSPPGRQHGF